MPKSIETLNGYIDMPDYTQPGELVNDLRSEFGVSQPQRVGEEDTGFSSKLGDFLRRLYESDKKDFNDLKTSLSTALNGPDMATEQGASSIMEGHYKQDQIDAVNELVSKYGMLSSAGSAGQVPEGSLGTFVGLRAAYKNDPELFKKMIAGKEYLEAGVGRNETYDLTQTFLDKDKKLKAELGDVWKLGKGWDDIVEKDIFEQASNNPAALKLGKHEGTYTVGDLFENDKLLKLYPNLKDFKIKLNYDQNIKPGADSGYFNPFDKEIAINAGSKRDVVDVLAHETQHYIQNEEGFAYGASPDNTYARMLLDIENGRRYLIESLNKYKSEEARQILTGKLDELDNAQSKLIDRFGSSTRADVKGSPDYNYDFYEHTLGEAEARNTANRMSAFKEGSTLVRPWDTLDVPEEDLISILYKERLLPRNE